MAKMTAEEFLAEVQQRAANNGFVLDGLSFTTESGMNVAWFSPDEGEQPGWAEMEAPDRAN